MKVWVVLVDGSGTLHMHVDGVRVFATREALEAERARTDGGFGGYAGTGQVFGLIDIEGKDWDGDACWNCGGSGHGCCQARVMY